MRLSLNKIEFVKERTLNGMTYGWFVAMRYYGESDARNYSNYENGRTVATEYPVDRLPETVQKFIQKSDRKEWSKIGDDFVEYIYRGELL